jgi:uncharacterized damage-inducible protein DinB
VQRKNLTLILFCLGFSCLTSFAQDYDGVSQGYQGEWSHVSEQLIALAEATPEEKFSWRPSAGVRSTSEVYMHIVNANFLMLNAIGSKPPADFKPETVKLVTDKTDVIRWLKLSLEAVKQARLSEKPEDLQSKVKIFNTEATIDAIFLRIIVHNNEHMGQLVAYARMTGVVPPWSK